MYFEQKLNTLMHLFKLSNSKLARGINVDPSLVSRWRSGERRMSSNSPHVPAIASYFLHLNAYHYQRDYLDRILHQKRTGIHQLGEADRIRILAEWLVSNDPLRLPDMDDSEGQSARNTEIINSLATLMNTTVARKAVPGAQTHSSGQPFNTSLPLPRGLVQQHELFEGRQGMRLASTRLLQQVIGSEKPVGIFLTSEDAMDWMTEDPAYTSHWSTLMRQVLQKGHQITIIHIVNRGQDELMKALALWTPLHLAGNIRSFYAPNHMEQPVRRTLFVVSEQLAIVGYHTGDRSDKDKTFLYQDIETVRHFENIFKAHLSACKPLFSAYSQRNFRQFIEALHECQLEEGTFSHIRHQFNAMILPTDRLMSLLPANGTVAGRQVQTEVDRQSRYFFQSLATSRYIDILPFNILDRIRKERSLELTSGSLLQNVPDTIRGDILVLYLQNLIAILKSEDNYELLFSTGNSDLEKLSLDIALKENKVVFVSSPDSGAANPIMMLLNESRLLHSFHIMVDEIIEKIPSGLKSKPDVIRLLESLLSDLKSGR